MDRSQWPLLGVGVLYVIAASVYLIKAIRRRQHYRIFDAVVSSAFLAVLFLDCVTPAAVRHTPLGLRRWVMLPLALLILANWFGFGKWAFNKLGLSTT